MPSEHAFLAGFFPPSQTYAGWTILSASSTHQAIIRFKEYTYHITITFVNKNSTSTLAELKQAIRDVVKKSLRINSNYGNPYRCTIDNFSDADVTGSGNTYTFHLVGHGTRVYN